MKKIASITTPVVLILFLSCKQKKNDVFPAIDFIKAQVARVDSGVDPIIKLDPVTDSTFDTTYIDRKTFNRLAKDFTEAPDISKKFGGKYLEDRTVNEELGLIVFTATPVKNEDLEIARQEIRIKSDPPNDKVKSIYIERFQNYKDSTVIKRMTWYTDWKLQVVTIVQKDGLADSTSVLDVRWGNDETPEADLRPLPDSSNDKKRDADTLIPRQYKKDTTSKK
jgi:hypothetical protein